MHFNPMRVAEMEGPSEQRKTSSLKRYDGGDEEMALQQRAPTTLLKDLGSIPHTHKMDHNHL